MTGLVRASEGTVRLLNPEEARWFLCSIPHGHECTQERLPAQFQVVVKEQAGDFVTPWLSQAARHHIQYQIKRHAELHSVSVDLLEPCWRKQKMSVVALIESRVSVGSLKVDWRLVGEVTTLRQLFMALGGTYTAKDIHAFWESLPQICRKRSRRRAGRAVRDRTSR